MSVLYENIVRVLYAYMIDRLKTIIVGEIVDKCCKEAKGCLLQECFILLDELVDTGLGLKVRHNNGATGRLAGVRQSAPDIVFKRRNLGHGFGQVDSLGILNVHRLLPPLRLEAVVEVRYAEDNIGALKNGFEAGKVVQVGFDHVNTFGGQRLRLFAAGVSGDAADFPLRVFKEGGYDGASLATCGANNDNEFLSHGFGL